MKRFLLVLGLLISTSLVYSQNEAFNWFFGKHVRLNFKTGNNTPQVFGLPQMVARKGSFCMSDKNIGEPIFYSNGENIWDVGDNTMLNGSDIYGSALSLQPGISFPVPGTVSQYYIFTTGNVLHKGCFYSIIDMAANSGLGEVLPDKKNIQIQGIDSAQRVVMATKHANNRWYWVIFRNVGERNWLHAYLVTENGVSTVPVKSECFLAHGTNEYAMSKFSPASELEEFHPDKQFYCYTSANYSTEEKRTFELYRFNCLTGEFYQELLFKGTPDKPEDHDLEHRSNGIEFSNDGHYLYSSLMLREPGSPPTPKQYIAQYGLSRTDTWNNFKGNIKLVHENENLIDIYCGMQLGRDGRIYITQDESKNNNALSRIYFPYKPAADCDFRDGEIAVTGIDRETTFGLPSFSANFLARFDWTHTTVCLPDTTQFKSTFFKEPVTVEWNFGDHTPTVTGKNPKHLFGEVGKYTVTATATYQGEEQESFSRIVYISRYPYFDLGADTISICPDDSVTLDVGLVSGYLQWSTGEDSVSNITVPVGRYWLKAENVVYGCSKSDTIDIITYQSPAIDNSNLYIFPTTCTGNTGYISGITINGAGPFTYSWKDSGGNTVSTVLNPPAMGAGTYNLNVTDGHSCPWTFGPYTVNSIGDDFLTRVDSFATVCGQDNGSIKFTPIPLMRGLLDYQISDGTTTWPWQSDTLFKDLASGSYQVRARVKQNQSCINQDWGTLEVGADPRPPLVQANIDQTPELDNNFNGTLTIDYIGADFTYVIIDSLGFRREQFDNPHFTGLMSGPYQCFAYTLTNCSSDTIPYRVEQIYSTHLTGQLIGGAPVCKGEHTFADVSVHNFEGIVDFTVTLDYDRSKMTCLTNYLNLHDSLGSVNLNVNTATGHIVITWSRTTPLTLLGDVTLLKLEFATHNPGTAAVTCDINLTQFIEGPGYHLLVDGVDPTSVIIYDNPDVSLQDDGVCLNDPVVITPSMSPPGSYTFLWTQPNGFTTSAPEINIGAADPNHEGQYRIIITNTNNCKDTTTMDLTVYALPGSAFTSDSIYFDLPDTLFAAAGYQSYQWNTGDIYQSIMVNDSGYYSVVITDGNNCQSESMIFVNSKDQKKFFYELPNAFSPNGDGLNDVFRPFTDFELITKFSLTIFNRWGQMIYNTNDPIKGWDGKVNGLDAMKGPYGWTLVYSNYHEFNVKSKGVVWLIR
jgi:gliding motility-associated-like protein